MVRFVREPGIVGRLYQHVEERRRKVNFFRRPVSRSLSFLQPHCIELSKVETLKIISLYIQLF